MTCNDVGWRVTDSAGSSVAAEWSDRARTMALQPLLGWCGCVYKPGWLWPLRMAERLSKRATREGERKSTEALGHHIRAPRPERFMRSMSVWTRRACFPGACAGPAVRRLGDSAPRWPAGSPAYKLKGGYPHQVRLWLKASDEPVILIDDAKERTKLLVQSAKKNQKNMKVIESYGGNTVEYSTGLTGGYYCYRILAFLQVKM